MNEWIYNTMVDFSKRIDSIKSKTIYLQSRSERGALANLYKSVQNLGAQFPSRKGYSSAIYKSLPKKVNNSCPSCVKEKDMKRNIESAISFLQSYNLKLKAEIELYSDFDFGKNYSVHDIRPDNYEE